MVFKKGLAVFMWIVFLLSACGGRGEGEWAHPTLQEADSLVEDAPEKALSLLRKDSAAICGQGKAGVMGLWLLKIHAEDKLYVTHLSDSIMQEVVEYYDAHGTPAQRAQAHYVLGRVYCDMRLPGTAISSFKKVLGVRGEDADTYLYKYKAATWLGTLFEEKRLWRDAMAIEKRAYVYAKRSGRTSPVVYALRDIGRLHDYQGRGKQGIPYYRKASAIARKAGNAYLYNMVEEELAGVYIGQGMMAEARKSLSTPVVEDADVDADVAARYAIWGLYYEALGKEDSTLYFYKKSLPHGGLDFKNDVYKSLASLYNQLGNNGESVKYYRLYEASADSLAQIRKAEYADLLDYVEKSLAAHQAKLKVMRQKIGWMVMVGFLLLALVPLGVYTIYIYRKRKIERLLQHERMKVYREKMRSSREKDREELEALREKLQASSSEKTDLRQDMLQTLERLSAYKEEANTLREKLHKFQVMELRESECYRKFHEDDFQPRLQDFIELQRALDSTYDGFTFRLRELCPDIRDDELWACCLIKLGISPTKMCVFLSCKLSRLSMMRKRLYKKIFKKEGSATDFDAFIKGE